LGNKLEETMHHHRQRFSFVDSAQKGSNSGEASHPNENNKLSYTYNITSSRRTFY